MILLVTPGVVRLWNSCHAAQQGEKLFHASVSLGLPVHAPLILHLPRPCRAVAAAATSAGSKARQAKKSSGGGCQFYRGQRKAVLQLKEVILADPLEVRNPLFLRKRSVQPKLIPAGSDPPQ